MKKTLFTAVVCLAICSFRPFWGFFAHHHINRLAVFTLPPAMVGFYKKNLEAITALAVVPDKRRYAVPEEGPRHYLDLDHYGDSALHGLPRSWNQAVATMTADTLQRYGILPWHIQRMYFNLRDAFMVKDPAAIIRISGELGHYIGDAHVPLHTTENYNGQLTGQEGIHGLWESRVPELFFDEYNFFVGRAQYVEDVESVVWEAIKTSHASVTAVLEEEKKLAASFAEKRYSFQTRGNTTVKVYAEEYAASYHTALQGMVEKQMRASIKMTGDLWFTAWVAAGQPDLRGLIDRTPSTPELQHRREQLAIWKATRLKVREHE